MSKTRMYAGTKTVNPFKGCRFACTYCVPSFQALAKWQKCPQCKGYEPHEHPERLGKIPAAEIVFVCSSGDISFCRPEYTRRILAAICEHWRGREGRITYYLQSKRPAYFEQFLEREELVPGIALVTTLETNRCRGYGEISKAPCPAERHEQFTALSWPRKVVTIEPVMDFDLAEFADMIGAVGPEYVWIGYNTRPTQVKLPEPAPQKVAALIGELQRAGIEVRGKELRGLEMDG